MNPGDICKICGGKRSEHEHTVHAFADREGELETSQEKAKRTQQPTPVSFGESSKSVDPRENPATRLAEVMAHRGLIDDKDLLYVIGLGPQPWAIPDQPTLFGGG